MSRRKSQEPTPLDQVLAIAEYAKTIEATHLLEDIRGQADKSRDVIPWISATQLARDLGALGAAESYSLLDILTEHAVGLLTDTDPELTRLFAEIRDVKVAHGLGEDEDFYTSDAPAEWLELNRLWEQRFDFLRAGLLRQVGEPVMATEFVLRPDDFESRSAEGRIALFDVAEEDSDPESDGFYT